MQRQITTEEIVEAGLEQLRGSIHVSMPGSVVAYYPQDQTADVQPMINDVRWNLDTDSPVFEPWSVILRVPVMWPRMGGIVIAGFLQPNDQVILEAFDLDPTPWRSQGRSQTPVNPTDVRRLGGNYWRCNPTDLTGPIADAPTSQGLVVGQDGQPAQIVFSPGVIQLGRTGGDFVALASKVDTALSSIATFLGAHTHSGVTPGVGTSGPPAGSPPSPAPTGSSLIKAQ